MAGTTETDADGFARAYMFEIGAAGVGGRGTTPPFVAPALRLTGH